MLEIFKHALPSKALVPKSFADVKKLIWDFGFKSKKIHACINDCVLFYKEYENLTVVQTKIVKNLATSL